jgi:hypothetical protein
VAARLSLRPKRPAPPPTTPTCVYRTYICIYIQKGKTAVELAAGGKHGEVVGVLIGAGMAAGQWQDVNACLGSVICVNVCMCAGVYAGSEGGMYLDLISRIV